MPNAPIVVDLAVVDRNIQAFHAKVLRPDLKLRAHVKGHRTVGIALRQVEAGACGIAVHTTREARHYLHAGISDIVIAWPLFSPERYRAYADFAAEAASYDHDARVAVHVGHVDAVSPLAKAARATGVVLDVRIDVKYDIDRGVAPAAVPDLASEIELTGCLRVVGVTGYWGPATLADVARCHERARVMAEELVQLATTLKGQQIQCDSISVSGSYNALAASRVPGVTEVIAGAYALNDAGTALVGHCAMQDVAISIDAHITSTDVDGTVHTTADEQLADAAQDWDEATLAVCQDGSRLEARLHHVGDRVKLLPAHICPVAKGADSYTIIGPDGESVEWPALYFSDEN